MNRHWGTGSGARAPLRAGPPSRSLRQGCPVAQGVSGPYGFVRAGRKGHGRRDEPRSTEWKRTENGHRLRNGYRSGGPVGVPRPVLSQTLSEVEGPGRAFRDGQGLSGGRDRASALSASPGAGEGCGGGSRLGGTGIGSPFGEPLPVRWSHTRVLRLRPSTRVTRGTLARVRCYFGSFCCRSLRSLRSLR